MTEERLLEVTRVAVSSLCAPALYVARRHVAAEPALGGERGSLPRTLGILGDGASWVPLVVVGPSASLCSSRWP